MAKEFKFSILASFRDAASAGLNKLRRGLLDVGKTAGNIGGGRVGAALAQGGPITGFLFGGLAAGVKVATGLLKGLVGVARGVVGGIVSAFRTLISTLASVFRSVVSTVSDILRGLVKTAAVIGIGIGAAIGWQIVKGIKDNMQLADIRAVLRRLLGDAAAEAERYAEALSLKTPFTPMQMVQAVVGLAAVQADYRRFLGDLADWAAGAQRPLEEIVMIFQRAQVGQFGEAMEGARRALISMKDLQAQGATFAGGGMFQGSPQEFVNALMGAVRTRFRGMAGQAATEGSGVVSTYRGIVEALRKAVSKPWYDRFIEGLKQINAWLLKVAESETWQGIVTWSDRVAVALDRGLRRSLEWLTTRDWSFDNLKAALSDLAGFVRSQLGTLAGLFARKGDEGWEFGPLATALVEAFRWAAGEIRVIFLRLWDYVGAGLAQSLAKVLARMGASVSVSLRRAEERILEGRARKYYEEDRRRGAWRAPEGPWENLTPDEREYYLRGARLSRAEAGGFDLARAGADLLGQVAVGVSDAGRRLSEEAGRIDEISAGVKEHGQAAVDAIRETRQTLGEVGQQLFNVASEMKILQRDQAKLERRLKALGTAGA